MAGKIFISYRHEDNQMLAGRLRDDLQEVFGEDEVFMDLEIPLGADFEEFLNEKLAECKAMVAVVGHKWLGRDLAEGEPSPKSARDWVHLEIKIALERGVLVVPVLAPGAKMPSPESLPEEISRFAYRNALEVDNRNWSNQVEKLVEAIKSRTGHEKERVPRSTDKVVPKKEKSQPAFPPKRTEMVGNWRIQYTGMAGPGEMAVDLREDGAMSGFESNPMMGRLNFAGQWSYYDSGALELSGYVQGIAPTMLLLQITSPISDGFQCEGADGIVYTMRRR